MISAMLPSVKNFMEIGLLYPELQYILLKTGQKNARLISLILKKHSRENLYDFENILGTKLLFDHMSNKFSTRNHMKNTSVWHILPYSSSTPYLANLGQMGAWSCTHVHLDCVSGSL